MTQQDNQKRSLAEELHLLPMRERLKWVETLATFSMDAEERGVFPVAGRLLDACSLYRRGAGSFLASNDYALCVHVAGKLEARPGADPFDVVDAAFRTYRHTDGQHAGFALHVMQQRFRYPTDKPIGTAFRPFLPFSAANDRGFER